MCVAFTIKVTKLFELKLVSLGSAVGLIYLT